MPQELDITAIQGLSHEQAQARLAEEGFNELPSARRRSTLLIALGVVREPMFLLLVACGGLYLALGDLQEALLLLGFVLVIMGITLYQERKTERALAALRDLSSPRAEVIRQGRRQRIPGREVVREDIVLLAEGDRVPADAAVLWAMGLAADESLLTGESAPVRKSQWDGLARMARPGGEDLPFVYCGSLIVSGRGLARVLATGARTELGKIGKAIQTLEPQRTLLERQTARLVGLLAAAGLSLCLVLAVVWGVWRGNWGQGLLAGLTLAMATLPEEIPVVLTVFLALGAWRISRSHVLTRRVPALENLGAANVLCVDKTGTLTLNRMSVGTILAAGRQYDVRANSDQPLPDQYHELVEFAILASKRDPFDPMEKAINELGRRMLRGTEHLHESWKLVREYPLRPDLLALSHVWHSPDGQEYVIAAKGAPEAVADLCHMDQARLSRLRQELSELADRGLRVLGVARARFRQLGLPAQQHDFAFEFLGLVGLADPVRPSVAQSIQQCRQAGIRVVMITGDYAGTARQVAGQIGLAGAEEVLTGPQMDEITDEQLRRRIAAANICARVVPQQKLRLVRALKGEGQVVAMTGDGVNDAPALKAADIGIAMGQRGTDVAREAADLVLLDDDFSSIVRAVALGRRVFDNIQKAMSYILAIHVPIAGLSLIPVLLGWLLNWPAEWSLVLMPAHIVFLELIIDPACSIVFEAEPAEADIMLRKPRPPEQKLFGRRTVLLSVLQGLIVLAIVLGVLAVALARGHTPQDARALTFTTLIVANLGLILTNLSWSRTILATLRTPNAALWWVVGGALTLLGLVLYVPPLRRLFHFSTLHPIDLLISLAAGVTSVLWFEGTKVLWRRKKRNT